MIMQPHVKRLLKEYHQLQTRAQALSEFIESSPIFQGLNPLEQERLKKQHGLMVEYAAILHERLYAIGVNPADPTELTFGQKLCAADFNPGKHDKVTELKALFAEAADIIHDHMLEKVNQPEPQVSTLDSMFAGGTYGDIKRAQMMAVATVTNRH
jgi:hypothetical protein